MAPKSSFTDRASSASISPLLRYLYSLTAGQRHIGSTPEAWGEPDDLESKLVTVAARILFFYGKQDIFVQNTYPVLLSDLAPYADVYLQDEAGHHMEEERPHDFVGIVKSFLDAGTTNA